MTSTMPRLSKEDGWPVLTASALLPEMTLEMVRFVIVLRVWGSGVRGGKVSGGPF